MKNDDIYIENLLASAAAFFKTPILVYRDFRISFLEGFGFLVSGEMLCIIDIF